MSSTVASPNLEHLRNLAKDLLKAFRRDDPVAQQRIQAQLPRFGSAAVGQTSRPDFRLADALLVIAREQGFASWPKLKSDIEARTSSSEVAVLPAAVCVLDVETEEVDFDYPEDAVIAFVGVLLYSLQDGEYIADAHQCFYEEQMPQLEQFLRLHPDLIIGHNIFGFDYRVLRPRINLQGIVDKTVDTLLLIFERGESLRGLKLHNLCKRSIGEGKTLKGGSVAALWKQGEHEKVIAYNATDCHLTHKLWLHMLTENSVTLGTERRPRVVTLTPSELRLLRGAEHRFTFKQWSAKIDRDGYITLPPRRRPSWEDEDGGDLDPYAEGILGRETGYDWLYCEACDITTLVETVISPGFCDYEEVNCPECNRSLGKIRADLGHSHIGVLPGNVGTSGLVLAEWVDENGMMRGQRNSSPLPDAFLPFIKQRIEETRDRWKTQLVYFHCPSHGELVHEGSLPSEGEIPCPLCRQPLQRSENTCRICGSEFAEARQPLESPVDGSFICPDCLTAMRWMLQESSAAQGELVR